VAALDREVEYLALSLAEVEPDGRLALAQSPALGPELEREVVGEAVDDEGALDRRSLAAPGLDPDPDRLTAQGALLRRGEQRELRPRLWLRRLGGSAAGGERQREERGERCDQRRSSVPS
jgi:hypothetical protein